MVNLLKLNLDLHAESTMLVTDGIATICTCVGYVDSMCRLHF